MAVYPFKCEECGKEVEVFHSCAEYETLPRPQCCEKDMEQTFEQISFVLGRTPGKTTGFYALDYGRRATEDLTVPGKMEALTKAGILKNPFDDNPKSNSFSKEEIDAFSD